MNVHLRLGTHNTHDPASSNSAYLELCNELYVYLQLLNTIYLFIASHDYYAYQFIQIRYGTCRVQEAEQT